MACSSALITPPMGSRNGERSKAISEMTTARYASAAIKNIKRRIFYNKKRGKKEVKEVKKS
jgi:hypothetical protein